MKRPLCLIAAFVTLWIIVHPTAARSEVDHKALYTHLKKVFSAPPGIEFELKDLKPSAVAGFDQATLEIRFRGNVQKQIIHISADGRYYIMSDAFELAPSKVPGLMGTKPMEGNTPPQIQLAKDGLHFLAGELHDMTVDPDAVNLSKINLKGGLSRGPVDAPLVLVEYSDMQCPYCSRAHTILDKNLTKTYGKKVRWVFKNFPLTNIHPWAYNAAIAVSCAAKLKTEAAWKMNEAIFAAQAELKPETIREKVLATAKEAKLDASKFETCYDKQESKPLVEADIEEARNLGVDSTPTFFINGRKTGFRDFDMLKGFLDEMLADKTGKKG